jgi:hypothetical protein
MKRKETQQAAVFPTGNIMKASVLRTAALKTTKNDGPGFSPNVTVTSVATPYNRLADEL